MPYCFLNRAPADDGLQTDCPASDGLLLLADLAGLEWGIYDVNSPEGWSPESPVSAELAALIESARRYPPALAIARYELGDVFGDSQPTQAQLADAYANALRTHLSRQHEAPYIMAPCIVGEVGYLIKGEWYWVLDISGTPPVVSWISDDFHIYGTDLNDFDFTGQQLKRLGYSG